MRYIAVQVLTWGTIAGAIGSALLLAALGGVPQGTFGGVTPATGISTLQSMVQLAGLAHDRDAKAAVPTAASASASTLRARR